MPNFAGSCTTEVNNKRFTTLSHNQYHYRYHLDSYYTHVVMVINIQMPKLTFDIHTVFFLKKTINTLKDNLSQSGADPSLEFFKC